MERIKHLFEVENVAFVLLVNRDQIESYIKSVYGDVDARAYLLKFANLFVDLPHQESEHQPHLMKGRPEYCRILLAHFQIRQKARDPEYLSSCLQLFVDHFRLTLREIERVFAVLCTYYASLDNRRFTNEFLVAMLAVLKINQPPLYEQLRAARIPFATFLTKTELDSVAKTHRTTWDWGKQELCLCLMSDPELKKAMEHEKETKVLGPTLAEVARIPGRMNDRLRTIPYLCSQLDTFSLQPK